MWWRVEVVGRCRKSGFAAFEGVMGLVEALMGGSWAVLKVGGQELGRLRFGGCKIAGVLR